MAPYDHHIFEHGVEDPNAPFPRRAKAADRWGVRPEDVRVEEPVEDQ